MGQHLRLALSIARLQSVLEAVRDGRLKAPRGFTGQYEKQFFPQVVSRHYAKRAGFYTVVLLCD
jgi:hypothetical protein